MNALRALFVIALLALTPSLQAQPYAGISFSSARVDTITSPALSDRSNGVSPVVGYRFEEIFAVEVAYLYTGDLKAVSGSTLHSWRAKGFGIFALGFFPLGERLSLFGRIGAYHLEAEFRADALFGSGSARTDSNIGTRPSIGAGLELSLSQDAALRVSYEQVDGKDELDKMRTFSAGLYVLF